jgi:predicted membrane channel-forming protein YqfA (hemolysin III family)
MKQTVTTKEVVKTEPNWSHASEDLSLVGIHAVPPWLRFNRFILSGYRRQLTFIAALRTFAQLHNESVNVWSHFFPALWFVYLIFNPWANSWIMMWSLASFVLIFGASTVYHLFMPCCRSHAGYSRLICCDVVGALVSITTSGYSFILYGNRCADERVVLACGVVFGISATVILLCVATFTMTVAQRFQLFGLHCLLRLAISQAIMLPRVFEHGLTKNYVYHTASFFVIMLGGVFNVSRVPERWLPKTWRWIDYIGNSHNIWHYFCVQSCLLTMQGALYDQLEYHNVRCSWDP